MAVDLIMANGCRCSGIYEIEFLFALFFLVVLGLTVCTTTTHRISNKAVYTAESVTCDWAGAVMPKLPKKR